MKIDNKLKTVQIILIIFQVLFGLVFNVVCAFFLTNEIIEKEIITSKAAIAVLVIIFTLGFVLWFF